MFLVVTISCVSSHKCSVNPFFLHILCEKGWNWVLSFQPGKGFAFLSFLCFLYLFMYSVCYEKMWGWVLCFFCTFSYILCALKKGEIGFCVFNLGKVLHFYPLCVFCTFSYILCAIKNVRFSFVFFFGTFSYILCAIKKGEIGFCVFNSGKSGKLNIGITYQGGPASGQV